MGWCEQNQVDYLLDFARNRRLEDAIRPQLDQAKTLSDQQQPVRFFTGFSYRTRKIWSRPPRSTAL